MRKLPVTEEQVYAAKLLVKFLGGPENVDDPLIIAVANSEPMSEEEVAAALAD